MPLISQPGRYAATVKSAAFGESEKGTTFLQLDFAADNGDTISGWLYLSEAAFERSVKTLRETFAFNDDFNTAVDQVSGKRCSIVIDIENFEGKDRAKVKWINPEHSEPKPLSNAVATLAALSAKAARIARQSPTKAVPTAPRATPPPRATPAPRPAASQGNVDENEPF